MHSSPHHITSIVRHLRIFLVLMVSVVVFLVLFARPVMAAPSSQENTGQMLLVQFAEGTTPEMRDAEIAKMGGELVLWMHQINVAEIRLPVQAGEVAESFSATANDMISYMESDVTVQGNATFNDPDFGNAEMSYGLAHVHAMDAWTVITGSQEIVIAVVDTGIKLDHPEFAGRLVPGYDFVNHDEQADDDMGHGTHVAGVIAAALDNGQGIAGVCPNCRLMPVKVLNENNLGSWSQVAKGILFAVDNGARVINMSLGAKIASKTLASAVQYALDKDVIVVASAGNNGSDEPYYPAAMEGVIAVGATNEANNRWSRSNFGSYIDLVAPGALIYSTFNDFNNMYHGYTYMSGTSMAAPFVSGVAGLLLSADSNLTAQQVLDAMIIGAEDLGTAGRDTLYGYGRVSALGALMSPSLALPIDFTHITPSEPALVPSPEPMPVVEPVQKTKMFLPMLNNW